MLIELAHFGFGTPADIAGSGLQKIDLRYFIEAVCRIESRGELVCDRLIMDEAVGGCRADSLFVKAHRLKFTPLEASGFRSNQCHACAKKSPGSLQPTARASEGSP